MVEVFFNLLYKLYYKTYKAEFDICGAQLKINNPMLQVGGVGVGSRSKVTKGY